MVKNEKRNEIVEILIACFLGLWLTAASLLAYYQMKKEYKNLILTSGEEKK